MAAVAIAAAAIAAAAPEPAVALRPFAREYAPGELVRFVAEGAPATSSLRGEFLGAEITFIRTDERSGVWVGWGVIPLDAKPGVAKITLNGKDAGEIQVAEKTFPEQRLTVESKFVNPPKGEQARIDRERKKLGAIYARRTALPPPGAPFVRPVPGEPTSEFGTRRFFNGEPRAPHPGIDLRASTGTPVMASGPGRVALATDLYYSGGTVIVDHGAGLFTVYAHLSKIEIKEGAAVKAGDEVGKSGATGRVTGPHLHWGARVGEAIFDPRALLDPRLFGRGVDGGAKLGQPGAPLVREPLDPVEDVTGPQVGLVDHLLDRPSGAPPVVPVGR